MVIGRKGKMPWLRQRFLRLGVPFIVAVLLLGPSQLFLLKLAGIAKGDIPADRLLANLPDLLLPGEQWIMHLWFLPALIAYSGLLAGLLFLSGRPPSPMQETGSAGYWVNIQPRFSQRSAPSLFYGS